MVLHKAPIKGDFVLETSFDLEGGASSAQLVFFCGWNGRRATGCDFRGNLGEIDGSGDMKVRAHGDIDGSKFKNKARNSVKLVRDGAKVTYFFNGAELCSAEIPATEGPCGIVISQQKALIATFGITGQLGDMKSGKKKGAR